MTLKKGDEFRHKHFLDPGSLSPTEKAKCTVTAVRQGWVYWTYTKDYNNGDHVGIYRFMAEKAAEYAVQED